MYLDENEKPEIGEGLNKSAEVTLHKVYRIDKKTNRPTTDKEAIGKFERKLKTLAAAQNARFISYNADTGTWVFEVEHFSKYVSSLVRCSHLLWLFAISGVQLLNSLKPVASPY